VPLRLSIDQLLTKEAIAKVQLLAQLWLDFWFLLALDFVGYPVEKVAYGYGECGKCWEDIPVEFGLGKSEYSNHQRYPDED
jgi:hypothetical protein